MKNLDGKTIAIGQLLSQDFFFRIPEYQRPFSWDEDNFVDLVGDLIAASKDQEYFLGTIVLHKTDKRNNYDVVDGQQRLTSLMVLLACFRDRVKDKAFKEGVQDKILQKENVVDGIPAKVRLEVKDREIFNQLVVADSGTTIDRKYTDFPEPESRYIQAANVFNDRLKGLAEKDIQDLVTFVSQKCVVIYLATSTFDDAFRLFTIVNDRGKQLRRIDVLKSINIAPDVVTRKTTRDRIAQRWEALEKDVGESTFESVFHLIRLIILKDKPQGDLLKEFEDRIFGKGKAGITKGETFVDLVFEYVDLFRKIFIDRDIIVPEEPTYKKYRALIHIMNSEFSASEWKACLLFFAKKFGGKYIHEFCLKLEKVYLQQWVQGVRKDERYSKYSTILELIENAKTPKEVIEGITYDKEAIEKAIDTKNIYGTGYCKYLLLRLELLTCEYDTVKEFNAVSIEHVLPVNPDPDPKGYWASRHNLAEISEYVNTIGNLVLLSKSKNSSAGNYDFPIKKDRYLKSRVSDYPRSIQILSVTDWLKDTIINRTAEAKKMILNDP